MSIIQKEKTHLAEGKRVLTDLGYSCEIGAEHVFVYVNGIDYTTLKELELELADVAQCPVWVTGA